jgi:hypothetical protein
MFCDWLHHSCSLIVNLHLISILAICVVQPFNPGVIYNRSCVHAGQEGRKAITETHPFHLVPTFHYYSSSLLLQALPAVQLGKKQQFFITTTVGAERFALQYHSSSTLLKAWTSLTCICL